MKLFYGFAILFLSVFFPSACAIAQKKPVIQTLNQSAYINSYTIDTITGTVYYGGNSAAGHLGAINGITGLAKPWSPFGFPANDEISQILFSEGNLFVSGLFTQIKGTARKNIAALDTNGNVLPWNPAALGLNVGKGISMASDKSYLYVGEFYSTVLNVIDKVSGANINNAIPIDNAGSPIIKIGCNNGFVFVLTETSLLVYKWKYDTSQNPIALQIVANEDLSAYGYYFDTFTYSGRGGGELVFYNDEVLVIDNFNYENKQSGALKFKWDSVNYKLTKQNYDLNTWTMCGPTMPYPDKPDYLYQPKINNATFYDSTLYVGGHQLSDMRNDTCGDPYSILRTNPYRMDSLSALNEKLLFGPDYYDARQLKAANNILYQVSTRKYISEDGSTYTIDYLSAHCLLPMRPGNFTAYKTTVCPEDIGINYSVPNVPGMQYTWTYSGKGATLHPSNTNSITIDFSLKPTAGTLTVIATSACGYKSPPRSFNIKVYSPPDANAGSDMQLTCRDTTVSLNGSSATLAAKYSWKNPGGTASVGALETVNKIGMYILTVTDTLKGCHWRDTAFVTIDTIKPTPIFPSGNYTINCATPIVSINGNSSVVNDSLRWIDLNGASKANPIAVQAPGTYKLIVINNNTGCAGIDSITIATNKTIPAISTSFTNAELTCNADSIILSGSSSTLNTQLFWIGQGDTLSNFSTVKKAGVYLFNVIDTISGCKSTAITIVSNNAYKPFLTAPSGGTLTCSTHTVLLNGSSVSPNSKMNWIGPGNYTSLNPATAAVPGTYTLIVSDTINGCDSSQSVVVDFKKSLELNSSRDSTICSGSNIMLSASPVGGTLPYSYLWMKSGTVIGTNNSQIVSPTDTSIYTVTISDSNGCVGSDSIYIFVPPPISATVAAFQSCDPNSATGELQVNATNGVPPYTYSIDGSSFQTSPVFSGLNKGQYKISIKDTLGCMQTTTAELSNNSSMPTADFLVSTNNLNGDTFVVVDISNPRPDTIIWQLPLEAQRIDSNMFAPVIVYTKNGSATITMKAYYGTCEMVLNKTIYFTPADSTHLTSGNNNGIEKLTIYPNPNNGTFSVELKLYTKQISVIQIFDASSVEKYKQIIPASDYYMGTVTIPQAENGTYILKVTAEHDIQQKTIIVSQ